MGESETRHHVYLSPGVHAAVIGSQLVFLDLHRDSYIAAGLDGEGEAVPARVARTLAAQFESLERAGLVVGDAINGSACEWAEAPAPTRHVFAPDDGRAFGVNGGWCEGDKLSAGDIRAFFLAFRLASHRLRRRQIAHVVAEVRSMQQRLVGISCSQQCLRKEVAVFSRLRPWFPARYLCLRDSLALTFFLLRKGIPCEWVFAVQMQPFGAHSWVQSRDILLNEAIEYAQQFTPVLNVGGQGI